MSSTTSTQHHPASNAHNTLLHTPFCRYASSWMTYWWGYEVVHKWMLTGKFTWDVPLLGRWLEWQYPGGKPPCDWFGVNYYSRWVFGWPPGGSAGLAGKKTKKNSI